jgi:hypothetical protein
VLGCTVKMQNDEVDRFQLGDVHFCFVYQSTALDESNFLKAIDLELQTNDVEEMRQKILAFGVKKVDVPDPHLYFQAPGGQVFKLVATEEDLSVYEESPSSRPGSSSRQQTRKQESEAAGGKSSLSHGWPSGDKDVRL